MLHVAKIKRAPSNSCQLLQAPSGKSWKQYAIVSNLLKLLASSYTDCFPVKRFEDLSLYGFFLIIKVYVDLTVLKSMKHERAANTPWIF